MAELTFALFTLILALAPLALFADEDVETTMEEVGTTTDEVMNDMLGAEEMGTFSEPTVEVVEGVGMDTDGLLTSEEYDALVDGATELTEETIDEVVADEVLVGDIVAVNEDEDTVVIVSEDGEFVVVPATLNTRVIRMGGRGTLRNPQPRLSVFIAPEGAEVLSGTLDAVPEVVDGEVTLALMNEATTEEGVVVATSVPVYRNGVASSLTSMRGADSVTVVRSEESEVLAVMLEGDGMEETEMDEVATGTDEEASSSRDDLIRYGGLALGLVLLLLIGLRLMRGGSKGEQ